MTAPKTNTYAEGIVFQLEIRSDSWIISEARLWKVSLVPPNSQMKVTGLEVSGTHFEISVIYVKWTNSTWSAKTWENKFMGLSFPEDVEL